MKNRHTPGPWIIVENASVLSIKKAKETQGFTLLASVPVSSIDHVCNAQLIAEAPNLLRQLRRMVKTYLDPKLKEPGEYLNTLNLAQEAIYNATSKDTWKTP